MGKSWGEKLMDAFVIELALIAAAGINIGIIFGVYRLYQVWVGSCS